MDDIAEIGRVRDLALRSIGRNVVAFQKMEGMLKFLVANHRIQGLPEKLLEIKEQNRRVVERQTMGSLVDKFFRSVAVDRSSVQNSSDDVAGEMSAIFNVEMDAGAHDEIRKAFLLVVEERNALIHRMLVRFNPNSLDSCQEISDLMESQRERLKPHYEYLKSIVKAILEGQRELLDFMESEAFPRMLDGGS